MNGWTIAAFTDVVKDVSGGNVKIPQREYLSDGPVPIVDQGRELIGGYTDASTALCKAELPVVVFGDHTRILKLVDFPFAMGADGVKVLKPCEALDGRFLYHYLRFVDIPSAGYDRHFKYLKRLEVPLPPFEEQRRIAAILDHADALRAKRREALARLDELTQSIFIDMFSDRESCELGGLLDFVTSGGRGWSKYYADEGEVFVRSLDVRMNRIDASDVAYVDAPDNAEARRTRTRRGDVLLTITGSRIGRAAPVGDSLAGAYVSQHVAILRPRAEVLEPQFLSAFLCHPSFGQRQIAKVQYGQTKPGLNFEQVRAFRLPSVPQELQLRYVNQAAALDSLRSRHKTALDGLDALFSSLQSRAFRGEL